MCVGDRTMIKRFSCQPVIVQCMMENIRKRAPIFKVDYFIRKICRNFLHFLSQIIYSPATLAWKSRWHSEDIDWIVSYPIRFERDYVKLLHPIRDLNRALHYIWRNRKHIQSFYRVLCNSPSHSRILIGSIRSIRGQTHDWRHHYKVFPSALQNGGTLWELR